MCDEELQPPMLTCWRMVMSVMRSVPCSKCAARSAGLLVCGDSTFPGIGVPAVAASGAIAANSLVPVWDHWKMLDRIGV